MSAIESHRRHLSQRGHWSYWSYRRCGAAASVVVLLAVTGCGSGDGDGQPTGPATPTTSPGSPPPVDLVGEPEHPAETQEYAERTVAAWAAPDLYRLAELAAADVHRELIELPGPPEPFWTFIRCDPPTDQDEDRDDDGDEDGSEPGESECSFHNTDGDYLLLTVDHELLGQPRAATGVAFDAASYPSDPVAYAEEFVTAWQRGNTARMRALAVDEVAAVFAQLPPAPRVEYTLDPPTGSLARVVITILDDEAPTEVRTSVSSSLLGDQQAIRTAEVNPG